MTRTLVLRPPAKINLTLHVGRRRTDGFHDVRSIIQSVALSDRLTIVARSGPMRLAVSPPVVPAGRGNLVWRAAALLWRALGRRGEPRGVRLSLEKSIPAAAGLGGASADAAAALVGLHAVWGGRLPDGRLAELAAEIGSDVAFFLVGGTALALGRGEEILPLLDATPLRVTIIKPAFEVSTPDAYGWFDDDARRASRNDAMAPAVDVGWPTGLLALRNDLQPAVARRHPPIGEMLEALRAAGVEAALMSGSGSAVYGLAGPAGGRLARRLARPGWQVISTRTLSRRAARRRVGLC